MQQAPNSDRDFYLLSPLFDTSPASAPSDMTSVFSGPSAPSHSGSFSPDSMLTYVPRTHPSLNLYKPTHRAAPLQRSENAEQPSVAPSRTLKLSTSKRSSRSHPYSDGDEDTLDGPLPEDATEQEKIDWRRRQNTLAARKSRKRKQDQMQQLQDDVQRLIKEKEVWKERALMMKQLLRSHGLPSPNFER